MKKAKFITANCRQRGFTMIEMMITVTLVAILASIAVPSMRTYVLNNRLNSAAQELVRNLQLARTEAVKRQHNIVVCASANPTADDATCAKTDIKGWIVFEDFSADLATTNNDWTRKTSTPVEPLIKTYTFDSSKIKTLADRSMRIAYLATGFAALGTDSVNNKDRTTSVVVCDSRGNVDSNGGATAARSVARGLVIAPTGRIRVTQVRDSSTDTNDIRDLLNNIGATC